VESEILRVCLVAIFIPFTVYKIYKFDRKLYKLFKPSMRKQLKEYLKINSQEF